MIRFFKSQKGGSYITTIVVVFAIALLFTGFQEIFRVINVANSIKESSQMVLDSYISDMAVKVYDSVRNGTDYTPALDNDAFYEIFESELKLSKRSGSYYSLSWDKDKSNDKFVVVSPSVSFRRANSLQLKMNYTLSIPIYWFGFEVSEANINMRLRADYVIK